MLKQLPARCARLEVTTMLGPQTQTRTQVCSRARIALLDDLTIKIAIALEIMTTLPTAAFVRRENILSREQKHARTVPLGLFLLMMALQKRSTIKPPTVWFALLAHIPTLQQHL